MRPYLLSGVVTEVLKKKNNNPRHACYFVRHQWGWDAMAYFSIPSKTNRICTQSIFNYICSFSFYWKVMALPLTIGHFWAYIRHEVACLSSSNRRDRLAKRYFSCTIWAIISTAIYPQAPRDVIGSCAQINFLQPKRWPMWGRSCVVCHQTLSNITSVQNNGHSSIMVWFVVFLSRM